MQIAQATNQDQWDAFLSSQTYSPFLQSWTMGEVYKEVGEEPIRLEIRENDQLVGICQAIVVPARRGKHVAVMYGPVLASTDALDPLMDELRKIAKEHQCSFIRMSPFVPADTPLTITHSKPSPLHLLGEHIWYLDLRNITEEQLMMNMRKTTRNLIRRAQKEGVEVTASNNPEADIEIFLKLHEETRKRHGFTPYTNDFFRAQLMQFAPRNEATLYLARYQGEVLAASIHMHMGGETSYHHGASTHTHPKIPASYLLQWTAVCDALQRGDHMYSFWGIAPEGAKKHPFKGVTTFKTGFGGQLLELMHCRDIPLSWKYNITRMFEYGRKWKRGF